MPRFIASRKKIERAKHHISDLNRALRDFADSDFYTLHIDTDSETGTKYLAIDYDRSTIPLIDYAVIVGDILHNLRSALDIAYCEIVEHSGGTISKWTRFRIRDTREELAAVIDCAFKNKQITVAIHRTILEKIEPYQAGNPFLWGLDDLNITDKHHLVIPVLEFVLLRNVRLENNKQQPMFDGWNFFFDESCRIRLHKAGLRDLTLKSQGHASLSILFPETTIFNAQGVSPTLERIAEEITRTIDAFEFLT